MVTTDVNIIDTGLVRRLLRPLYELMHAVEGADKALIPDEVARIARDARAVWEEELGTPSPDAPIRADAAAMDLLNRVMDLMPVLAAFVTDPELAGWKPRAEAVISASDDLRVALNGLIYGRET